MNETVSSAATSAFSNVVLGFICIAMATGTLGNLLVLVAFRVETSAFNALVVVLGLFDTLACLLHMPLDIASLFDPYMFRGMAICKITCFMIAFTATGSAILLVAIATMRYRAVCRPHSSNLSIKTAVVISVVSVVAAGVVSWPIVLMFGVTTVSTDKTWVFCGVQNAYMMSGYPLIFYIVLVSLFAAAFTAMAVLYLLTARELWKKRKVFAAQTHPKQVQVSTTGSDLQLVNMGSVPSQSSVLTDNNKLSFKNQNTLPVPPVDTLIPKSSKKNPSSDKKTQRTFLMMFLVSVVFFLSYTPHFVLAFYFMAFNMAAFPRSATTPWYGVFMRSFYINNVADPFIYGFCSQEFRKNVRMLGRKIGSICRRKS